MKRLTWFIIVLLLLPIQGYSAQSEQVKIPKLKQLKLKKDLEMDIFPAENKGKWGFADEKGKFVIKPVFSQVTPFENQLSKVAVDDFWGIIRRDATYLFEPQFSAIEQFVPLNNELEIAKVVRYGRYGIISSNGDTLLQPAYESIDTDIFLEYGYFLVQEEGHKGVVDEHGITICDSQYEKIYLVKSKDSADGYCFLAISDGKYSLIIPPSGSEKSQIINAGKAPNVVGCKYGIHSLDDGILEGIGICADNHLYSVSGKKYQIPPVDEIQYRNGGAILKCDNKEFYILKKGKVMSYYEYNLAMSENAYADDDILPEWARLFSTKDIRSKSKPIITFSDGNLRLKYESIPGGRDVGGFIGGFGLTDIQGRWLIKPVLTKSQIKTTAGVRIYPCDLAGSAIVGYNGKYGRVSNNGLNVPLIFNSYEEAVKYNGHKLQNSDYYVVISEERTENGFQKYGYADNNKMIIPIQYYCYDYGDVGYLVDDISPAGLVVVNTSPSDSRKLVVINLENEVVGPPVGVDAYKFIKELTIKSLFRITEIPIRYDGIESIDNSGFAVYKNGKYGLIDKSGREVTPCVYDKIIGQNEGMIQVMSNEKYGYLDGFGKEVIPCIYDYAGNFSDGYACVKKDGKFGIIKKDGHLALPLVYDFIESLTDGVAPIKRNGKYGLFARGKEMVPCTYDSYEPWDWGEHFATFRNGNSRKKKYISTITGDVYDEIEQIDDALAKVKKDGKTSYISTTGKIYSDCSSICDDSYRIVENNGKRGAVDKSGKEVLPCIYEHVGWSFVENYLCVKKNGKWGFVDTNWKEVLPCIYEDESVFSEGYASVKKGGKWGYINKKGESRIPFIFDEESNFHNGYACVIKDGSYGVIDIMGKEVIPFIYDGIVPHMSGSFVVERNDKYGIIDKSGNEVLPIVYDFLEGNRGGDISTPVFVSDLIAEKDGKYGVIDNKGKEIIPFLYNCIEDCLLGLAKVYDGDDYFYLSYMGKRYEYADMLSLSGDINGSERWGVEEAFWGVRRDNKMGIINKEGIEVVPCIYDRIEPIYDRIVPVPEADYFAVSRDNKSGIINKEGIEVVPCIYDQIEPALGVDCFAVSRDNKSGIINKEGIEVVPCIYDFAVDEVQFFFGGVLFRSDNPTEEYFVSFNNKKYDWAEPFSPFSPFYTFVFKDSKIGVIDKMGREVIECVYDMYYDNTPDQAVLGKDGKMFIIEPIHHDM